MNVDRVLLKTRREGATAEASMSRNRTDDEALGPEPLWVMVEPDLEDDDEEQEQQEDAAVE